MKNSKKGLSGILAVLMLVSMLACFALPAAAASDNYYYVSTVSEWNDVAAEINGTSNGGAGKTIYVLRDIDFNSNAPTQITKFAGTLDGKGYKFTNIAMSSSSQTGASLIGTLTGTIQNLTLADSCTFENTFSGYDYGFWSSYAQIGAFAATSSGGTIQKCASYATYTATGNYVRVGGLVGAATGATTIDGCIFDGTVTASGTKNVTANAFVGYPNGNATVQHSIARGTLTGLTTAIGGSTITNSYAVNAGESTSYSSNTMVSLNEAVWTINDGRRTAESASGTCSIYLNVDSSGVPCFGDANNRVVKLTYKSTPTDSVPGYYYYAPRETVTISSSTCTTAQTRIDVETVYEEGIADTVQVDGAEYRDGYIYIGNSEITVVGASETNESGESDTQVTAPEGNPSISEYDIYKDNADIKDYNVNSKEDWIAAVAMSNFVENPDAVNFEGITLHLTADINMGGTEMLPLCYGWYFDGNLDGHDHVFQNININVDSPYGPVGLIGVIGDRYDKTNARSIQNVGIASGNITVTGLPRFKADLMNITDDANIVGGIVGKNGAYSTDTRTLIRKCWNNADISVENGENVAGIIGVPRHYAAVDSCFNLGQTTGYGIQGYGYNNALVCNSMSGPVHSSAMLFRGNVVTSASATGGMENVYGVRSVLRFDQFSNATSSPEDNATQKEYFSTFNASNTVFSDAAAAWAVNENYVDKGYGERVYYTLDENGEVRFGNKDNQICRIAMVCECEKDENDECANHPTRYAYGVAGREIALNFDFDANYYACAESGVSIDGNTLTFESAPKAANEANNNTFTVHVGFDAARGDVKSDGAINVLDVLKVVQMVAGNKPEDLLTADVDSDYDVGIDDAYQIIRYVFNMKEADATPFEYKAESESDYLKVLSYNVKGLYYDPNTTANDSSIGTALSRKDAVLAELNAVDADIMGFQEIIEGHSLYTDGKDALEEIYNGLSWIDPAAIDKHMHYVSTRNYSSGGTAGNGIISKYPIITFGTVKFADIGGRPDDETKRLDDSTGAPRAFTWYKIDLNGNGVYDQGTDIIFYNTHLAISTVPDASAAQLKYIVEYMNTNHANDRVVGAGDFNLGAYKMEKVLNAAEGGETITPLNGGKLFNTYVASNASSGSMVDNILINSNVEYFNSAETKLTTATGLSTRVTLYDANQAVTTDKTLGWAASDHLPIWGYIKNPAA